MPSVMLKAAVRLEKFSTISSLVLICRQLMWRWVWNNTCWALCEISATLVVSLT